MITIWGMSLDLSRSNKRMRWLDFRQKAENVYGTKKLLLTCLGRFPEGFGMALDL